MSLATLPRAGRAAMAEAIAARPLHFAWGTGNPAWDTDDKLLNEPLDGATALVAELGRRIPTAVGYALPDPAGDIVIPVGRNPDGSLEYARYRQSVEPTAWLYLRVAFDFDDASNSIVREVAVFIGTQVKPSCPPGQRYFLPSDISGPGRLLSVQRLSPPLNRMPGSRPNFEFVLPI